MALRTTVPQLSWSRFCNCASRHRADSNPAAARLRKVAGLFLVRYFFSAISAAVESRVRSRNSCDFPSIDMITSRRFLFGSERTLCARSFHLIRIRQDSISQAESASYWKFVGVRRVERGKSVYARIESSNPLCRRRSALVVTPTDGKGVTSRLLVLRAFVDTAWLPRRKSSCGLRLPRIQPRQLFVMEGIPPLRIGLLRRHARESTWPPRFFVDPSVCALTFLSADRDQPHRIGQIQRLVPSRAFTVFS